MTFETAMSRGYQTRETELALAPMLAGLADLHEPRSP